MATQKAYSALTQILTALKSTLDPLDSLLFDAVGYRSLVLKAIGFEDWTKLKSTGTKLIKPALNYYGKILKTQATLSANQAVAEKWDRQQDKIRKKLKIDLKDPKLRKELTAFLKKQGIPAREIPKALRSLNSRKKLDTSLSHYLDQHCEDLENKAAWCATLALLGLQCLWFSRFNRAVGRGAGSQTRIPAQLKRFGKNLKILSKEIEKIDKKTHQLTKAGRGAALSTHCQKHYGQTLKDRGLAKKIIDLAIAIQKLRKRPTENLKQQETLNELALQCGALVRRLVLSLAISFRMAYVGCLDPKSARARAEIQHAKKKPYPSQTPQGERVSLTQLLQDPSKYHKKLVCVSGEVRFLSTRVLRRKPISRFRLLDLDKSQSIQVFVPWVQIDSMGLKRGSSVEIVGLWHKYDRESRQKNTLHIDRIAFTQQAKKSWLDYQASEVRKFCDYLPHNFNMRWSLEPSRRGAVNLLRYTHAWGGKGGL